MATFKIALEDKAAFLNRMEKAGVALDTDQAVDNKKGPEGPFFYA